MRESLPFAITIFNFICYWKIMTKMGKEGWKGLIPIYNSYIFWKKVWSVKAYLLYIIVSIIYFFACAYYYFTIILNLANKYSYSQMIAQFSPFVFISIAYIIFIFVMNIKYKLRFAKAFGKEAIFAVGMIFVPVIFNGILAFDNSEYVGDTKYSNYTI